MAASTLGEELDDELENFQNKIDDLQNQIDEMRENVSNALIPSTTAQANTYIITHRVSTLEEENKPTSNARRIPDSNGFWRDKDGDIWAYDGEDETPPIILFDSELRKVYGQQANINASWIGLELYAPFTKVDNPFIKGEDHAD